MTNIEKDFNGIINELVQNVKDKKKELREIKAKVLKDSMGGCVDASEGFLSDVHIRLDEINYLSSLLRIAKEFSLYQTHSVEEAQAAAEQFVYEVGETC